jgi:hypothetical protein
VLALVLVPVAALVGGALVYHARTSALARGSAAENERARAASSVDTTENVAEPSGRSWPEPAPPSTSRSPEPDSSVADAGKRGAGGPAAAAPASAVTAGPSTGILDTTHLPAGRRMVVDGRLVGASPRRVAVPCGTHRVTIGELEPESIAVPCGGEVTFDDQ